MINKGDTFTHRFTVDEHIYNGFISIFSDRNPLHTDEQFAQTKGFTGKVMHGNILGGFLSYFIGELLPVKNVIIHWQKIEYKKPVYLNDQINLLATVEEFHESVNAIEFKFSFTNQQNVKLATGRIQIGILK